MATRNKTTANDDTNSVSEDQTLIARGNVLTNDQGRGLSVLTAGTFAGIYGTLVIRGTGAGIEPLRSVADPLGVRNAILVG